MAQQSTDQDWKRIRAQQYEAARQKNGVSGPPPGSRARDAARRLLDELPGGVNAGTCAVAVLLVCLVAPVVVKRLERAYTPWSCAHAATAAPHATLRPAHAHRRHALDMPGDAFVRTYAACQAARRGGPQADGDDARKQPLAAAAQPGGGSSLEEGMWAADFDMHKGGITRCATTQYAAVTYFCGKAVADTDQHLSGFTTPAQLLAYLRAIEQVVQQQDAGSGAGSNGNGTCSLWPQLVFRFNIHEATDPHLGHTFAVHLLPEGGAQVYQSFIRHYTLRDWLTPHGPLDQEGFKAFMTNIEVITNATEWTTREDAAYKANFLVSLARGGKILLGMHPAMEARSWVRRRTSSSSSSGSKEQQQQQKPIQMLAELACLAAPWQGLAAGAARAAAAALLPPGFAVEGADSNGSSSSSTQPDAEVLQQQQA